MTSSLEPPRPLGSAGSAYWNQSAPQLLIEYHHRLLIVCEQMDERMALRISVLRSSNDEQRRSLRQLDAQIVLGMQDIMKMISASRAAQINALNTDSANRRATLEHLRDELMYAIESSDVAVKAQLAGQLRAVLREIEELPLPASEDSPLEKARKKRADRRASLKAVE